MALEAQLIQNFWTLIGFLAAFAAAAIFIGAVVYCSDK